MVCASNSFLKKKVRALVRAGLKITRLLVLVESVYFVLTISRNSSYIGIVTPSSQSYKLFLLRVETGSIYLLYVNVVQVDSPIVNIRKK